MLGVPLFIGQLSDVTKSILLIRECFMVLYEYFEV